MTVSQYAWIYGLAEALALVSVLAVVLGAKWWRLRQERQGWLALGKRIDTLLDAAIVRARDAKTTRPELRDGQIAALRALSKPFQQNRIGDDGAWHEAIGVIERCFAGLAKTTSGIQTAAQPEYPSNTQSVTSPDSDINAPKMDSDIDALLTHSRLGRSQLAASQSSGLELRQRHQELEQVNAALLAHLESISQGETVDMTALRQELDLFMQSNHALIQAAYKKDRNLNFLEQHFDDLEKRIHNLQVTINNYRHSVVKLITERDLLLEEKQRYLSQLEIEKKVIARLNRNYDALKREYTKSYNKRN